MSNLKLYMTPGSCSTGIHILMEELELIFEAYIVNLPAGDQFKPDYMAINPKSTIPTLVKPDGTAITEFSAIAYWLARSYPKARLLPGDVDGDALVLETMNYVVSTLHMQGFTRIFTTDQYAFNESDRERVKAQGETIVKKGFAILNKQLAGKTYLAGEFSIADAALFYCEFWASRIGITLPEHCLAHYQRMLKRPAVKQVLMEEGYSSLFQ
ncbi:glutathione S-transferase family protein [Methylobacter sp. YRD-M1]|uniref:glutathione S-transferase family protein n=1 Tax=Methylobacter sp. YRD-M1 TaxID=2911520 RepID=UPI00227C50DC|nr:glutathione S-transferase family protein [Methylobacter sp. YRD-M1]WAK02253.1 glutathione S-transferase family protein [Methylobacter sp. YRD-M1]